MQDRFNMPSALAKRNKGKLTPRMWEQLAGQGWQLLEAIPPNKIKLGRNIRNIRGDVAIYDIVECEPLLYARFVKELEKRAKAEEFLTAWIQRRERATAAMEGILPSP